MASFDRPDPARDRAGPIKVLVLAADPVSMDPLRLDEEMREIDIAIRKAEYREQFQLAHHGAVRASDLQDHLLRHRPAVVHFSGHGCADGQLLLEDHDGMTRAVPADALERLFGAFQDDIQCVVLSACYSAQQAAAIARHIGCVVGMTRAIGDEAAIRFSVAFYRALAYGKTIGDAFELGRNEIALHELGEEDTPKLLCRTPGAADRVFASARPVPTAAIGALPLPTLVSTPATPTLKVPAPVMPVPAIRPPETAFEASAERTGGLPAWAVPVHPRGGRGLRAWLIGAIAFIAGAVLVTFGVWTVEHEPRDPLPFGAADRSVDAGLDAGVDAGLDATGRLGIAEAPSGPCPPGMALVLGGTFTMGMPAGAGERDERALPAGQLRVVTLSSFCIDQTEVTVAAYARCPTCGPDRTDARSALCNDQRADRQDHPMNCVTWHEAAAYCQAHGKALPTEAQWEYVAKGATGRLYPWGDTPLAPNLLNACGKECDVSEAEPALQAGVPRGDGYPATAPVGRYEKGAVRVGADDVLDLAGNVREWTRDWYARYGAGELRDPLGPAEGEFRVTRGGSWADAERSVFRAVGRSNARPDARDAEIGFRCARAPL